MSDHAVSPPFKSSVSAEAYFPGSECQWLHDQMLQVLPASQTLLPAAVIQIPVRGQGPEALLDAWVGLNPSAVAVGRPLLLFATDLSCEGAPQTALERFMVSYPEGLHFCAEKGPQGWSDSVGLGLVPVARRDQPISNLINWMQRFRVPAWCRIEAGYHPWVDHSAAHGYLSARLVGADLASIGSELARLMTGPCAPTSFQCFEFQVVRYIVHPREDLTVRMPVAESFRSPPPGTVVSLSDLEQWQTERAGDMPVIVAEEAGPGDLVGLILRDATGNATLYVDHS